MFEEQNQLTKRSGRVKWCGQEATASLLIFWYQTAGQAMCGLLRAFSLYIGSHSALWEMGGSMMGTMDRRWRRPEDSISSAVPRCLKSCRHHLNPEC